MHTPYHFEVKGFDKSGKVVDSRDYHTPKLTAQNGHWNIVERMAITVKKNRKVKSVKYYMDGAEYVFDPVEIEFRKA